MYQHITCISIYCADDILLFAAKRADL